jgi:hypothetical protein
VISVRMMQMPIHKIVDVISVRDLFVTTAWTVNMTRFVTRTLMSWRAGVGVLFRYFDTVFIDVIPMMVMKMTIVKVVHMITVFNSSVSTIGTVNMVMLKMLLTLLF